MEATWSSWTLHEHQETGWPCITKPQEQHELLIRQHLGWFVLLLLLQLSLFFLFLLIAALFLVLSFIFFATFIAHDHAPFLLLFQP